MGQHIEKFLVIISADTVAYITLIFAIIGVIILTSQCKCQSYKLNQEASLEAGTGYQDFQ